MIKKITTGEYLKDYRTMTAQEREAYRKRVGEWLRTAGERLLALTDRPMAKSQNLMSMSARWAKEDCEAAHEGAVLLTALMAVTETWIPSQLWVKSAWRAVRKLTESLSLTLPEREGTAGAQGNGHAESAEMRRKAGAQGTINKDKQNDKPSKTQKEISAVSVISAGQKNIPATESQGTLVPIRPKHIDQYAYLLPKGMQERAGAVRGLLRELDWTREKMRLLMEDVNTKPDARAAWAKRATKIDATLKGIYKELDAEWEKLVKSGRITVDALGNASLSPDPSPKGRGVITDGGQEAGASTPLPVGEWMGERPLTSEQKARRRELRKWLIDLRRGKEGEAREKRIEQWKENWKEYLTLEPLELALKDEKVVAAAAHFGIDITRKE